MSSILGSLFTKRLDSTRVFETVGLQPVLESGKPKPAIPMAYFCQRERQESSFRPFSLNNKLAAIVPVVHTKVARLNK